MKKLVFTLLMIISSLQADDFDRFLDEALQNNAAVQSAKTAISQTALSGKKSYRYNNPVIQGSIADYGNDNGFNIALSQELALPGTNSDLKKLASLQTEEKRALYLMQKADFIRKLSLKYLDYRQKEVVAKLVEQESLISKKIYEISQKRFQAGNISRTKLMQAELAWHRSMQREKEAKMEKESCYYNLLLAGGIGKKIPIAADHTFSLKQHKKQHPSLSLLLFRERVAQMRAQTTTKIVPSIQLEAEFEKEPEQDITRLGIGVPLPLFNRKAEEKEIAKLSVQKERFTLKKFRQKLFMKRKKLYEMRKYLKDLKQSNSNLIAEHRQLLKSFQEGYKIANINLLELQSVKRELIKVQKRQIAIQKALDANTINLNYLNGAYND